LLGKPAAGEAAKPSCRTTSASPLRLEIDVAEPAAETPAERSRNASSANARKSAIASIEKDPFVREVVDLFDASIDESTIKPV
jgi:DNA polymerase-3 subunit gamma/tau